MKYALVLVTMLLVQNQLLSQDQSTNGENTVSPVASIANYEMNVLYVGYDNRVSAVVNGFPKTAKVSCDDCSSIKRDSIPGVYVVRVGSRSSSVVITVQHGNRKISQNFRVIPMPKPVVFIAGTDPLSRTLPGTRVAGGILTVQLIGSPLSISGSVIGGTITLTFNGISRDYSFLGNRIPPQVAAIIRNAKPGSFVVISPKVQMGGQPIRVSPIAYRIQ